MSIHVREDSDLRLVGIRAAHPTFPRQTRYGCVRFVGGLCRGDGPRGGGRLLLGAWREDREQLKAPPAGARVIPLQVAGAFHTRYMQPAVDSLRAVADGLTVSDPSWTIWTNRDGAIVRSGSVFVDLLIGQVASPVRWDLDMEAFAAAGVTGLIELTPAGALTGLAKRALKGLPIVAVKTPDDIAAAHELLDAVQDADTEAEDNGAAE